MLDIFRKDNVIRRLAIFLAVFLIPLNIFAVSLVNINSANLSELDSLPGIGETKAQAIIDYRNANGDFQTIEDIMSVSGIGQATFDGIKNLITVEEVEGEEPQVINEVTSVVINELLPNPEGSDDYEWIELKNVGESQVDVNGWEIGDATGNQFEISSSDLNTIIEASGFLVLEKSLTSISLNNSGGESVLLYDGQGNLVDEMSYVESAAENISCAREDSIFHWTTTLTKGGENIITVPVVEDNSGSDSSSSSASQKKTTSKQKEDTNSWYVGRIYINEIFADPEGIDSMNYEWIEIVNTSTNNVILDDWVIRSSNGEYVFEDTIIERKSKMVLKSNETRLFLNNIWGDSVELIDREGKEVDMVKYSSKARENMSYNLCWGDFVWLENISPGENNICPPDNALPKAYFDISSKDIRVGQEIYVEATESYDPDGEIINFVWLFEKPVEIIDLQLQTQEFTWSEPFLKFKFLEDGSQIITLHAIDDIFQQGAYTKKIYVDQRQIQSKHVSGVVINEIFPDPDGLDTEEEFIELKNISSEVQNISGCYLDDESGGSSKYYISDVVIVPGEIKTFEREETKIALNNSSDEVNFVCGETKQNIIYDDVSKGMSYARKETGEFDWTGSVTKGGENIFKQVYINSNATNNYGVVNLGDVKKLPKGSLVTTSGVVSVDPGTLGANIFYISGSGIQIYMSSKDFPDITLGDRVQVTGTMSESYNEKRINVKNKSDIVKEEYVGETQPLKITLDEVSEEHEGSLLSVEGDVVDMGSQDLWLDDGLGEIRVYIKKTTLIDIKEKGVVEGDRVRITGILSETTSGYRLLPRYDKDIIVTKVLGEQNNGSKQKKDKNWVKYLVVSLIFVLIVTIFGIITLRKEKTKKCNLM